MALRAKQSTLGVRDHEVPKGLELAGFCPLGQALRMKLGIAVHLG